jgi:hemolysin D
MADQAGQPANLNTPPRRATARRREDLAFLPAAVEIVETPASALPRGVAAVIMAFLVISLAWACLGHIDIIATAQGKVVPVGRSKTIQPLETGMITEIHVNDGARVAEGQILVELDHTTSTAERNRIRYDFLKSSLDVARLKALGDGFQAGTGPTGFVPPPDAPRDEVARTRLAMLTQAEQQAAKIAGLDRQIAQKAAEIEEIDATITKLKVGLSFVEQTAEVREKAMKLKYGNLIAHLEAQLQLSDRRNDLLVQERRAAESTAGREALEWQREQAKAEYAHGIMTDLADAEPKAAQFAEDLIKAEKKMADETLRAPIAGTVQQLAVHTIGGVVTPAQQLMVIAPMGDGIEIEAMVLNKDIGFVQDGQPAEVKIDTFNFTKYGLLHGEVLSVSRDAVVRDKPRTSSDADAKQAGQSASTSEPPGQELVYAARVSLNRTQMEVEGKMVDLSPGMAVTVEIKTGQRRIIEYLLSPLLRYKQESLHER